MAIRKKLEVGAGFRLEDIEAFAKRNNYPIKIGPDRCHIYNNKGQYTSFNYYDSFWFCDIVWALITNPKNPYYLGNAEDIIEIYE